jgi:hypothetical protein
VVEQPVPDTKDWTWVLDAECPECGFDARLPGRDDLAALAREVGGRWQVAMAQSTAPRERPAPAVWSPLEYACHVRDVLALATVRHRLMLDLDDPEYANWDQDATAIADGYADQDPAVVTGELMAAADEYADALDTVPPGAWDRPGRRGDGARFSVASLARYLLHDPVHHLTDVTGERWG